MKVIKFSMVHVPASVNCKRGPILRSLLLFCSNKSNAQHQSPQGAMVESGGQLHRYINGHKGRLYKQSHVFKSWKQRFFVLERKTVKYFEDEFLSKINGEYTLTNDTLIFDVPGESDGHKFLFYLTGKNIDSTEDILFVSATSEKDKKEWIEAFSDAINNGFKMINQPELWNEPFYPIFDLIISYPSILVENGNIIKPTLVEHSPKFTSRSPSDANISDRFSLIMIDFDATDSASSSTSNNVNFLQLHWGVVNMLGSDLATGHEVVAYKSPAPAYNSGLHRYFFLLFRHPAVLSAAQLSETVSIFQKKDSFALYEWVALLGLGSPVGINGFYSGWEERCDALHEREGYLPPVKYRSHKQDSAVLARSEQYKIEQCKLDLYADLSLQDLFPPALVDIYAKTNLRSLSMTISYQNSLQSSAAMVRDGNILTPSSVVNAPHVAFDSLALAGDSCDLYTLVMCDPDAPSRVSPSMREFVHWVVVNIPGGDVRRGDEVVPYLGAAPPHASGLHRYVFSLYKQTELLSSAMVDSSRVHFETRGGLQTHDWVRSECRGLLVSVPVALEAFLCEWEPAVDAMHAAMGWTPPSPYQSPAQRSGQSSGGAPYPTDNEQALSQLLREDEAFRAADTNRQEASTAAQSSRQEMETRTSAEDSASTPSLSTSSAKKVSVASLVKKYSISNIEEKISASQQASHTLTSSNSAHEGTLQLQHHHQHNQESVRVTESQRNATTSHVTSTVSSSSTTSSSFAFQSEHMVQQQQFDGEISHHMPQHFDHADHPPASPSDQQQQHADGHQSAFFGDAATESERRTSSTSVDANSSPKTATSSAAPLPVKKFVQRNASTTASSTTAGAVGAKKPSIQRSPSAATISAGLRPSAEKGPGADALPSPKGTVLTAAASLSPRGQTVSSESVSPNNRQRTAVKPSAASSRGGGGGGSNEEVRSRSLTATNTAELCDICGISTTSVFDGETMKKKFSKDFMFKDSFLWVEPHTRTLHWGKSVADKSNPRNQKYLALDHINSASRIGQPAGESKGVMRGVEVSGSNIVITVESGEVLEMKLSPDGYPPANKRANDWAKVMRALSDVV